MGKRIPVVMKSISFKSLKEATEYFSGVLHSYQPGDTVSALHERQIRELLKRHPDVAAKTGVGIRSIEVIDADFDTQCFAVRRTDGSFEDFSFHTCVSEGRY